MSRHGPKGPCTPNRMCVCAGICREAHTPGSTPRTNTSPSHAQHPFASPPAPSTPYFPFASPLPQPQQPQLPGSTAAPSAPQPPRHSPGSPPAAVHGGAADGGPEAREIKQEPSAQPPQGLSPGQWPPPSHPASDQQPALQGVEEAVRDAVARACAESLPDPPTGELLARIQEQAACAADAYASWASQQQQQQQQQQQGVPPHGTAYSKQLLLQEAQQVVHGAVVRACASCLPHPPGTPLLARAQERAISLLEVLLADRGLLQQPPSQTDAAQQQPRSLPGIDKGSAPPPVLGVPALTPPFHAPGG